jgi:hypothetical protein
MDGFSRVGKKEGKVGIQGEFQIGIDERAWTLRQAPWEITGNEERMPLHSHEGAEWGGGREKNQKKYTYLGVGSPTLSLKERGASIQAWK